MKKLALNIEDLEVSSFETDTAGDERGTVNGAMMASGVWYCFGTWACSLQCPPEPSDSELLP